MARSKEDLSDTLAIPYDDQQQADDQPAATAAEPATAAATAESAPTDTKGAKEGSSKPRKRSPAKAAKKGAKPAQKRTQPRRAPAKDEEPIKLQPVTTQDSERVSCYFHPDEFRQLGAAKLDDKIPHNTRIRAMALVYNTDPRFKAKVDKVARESPRY